MGYVKTEFAAADSEIYIVIRDKKIAAKVAKLPFYKKAQVNFKNQLQQQLEDLILLNINSNIASIRVFHEMRLAIYEMYRELV